MKPTSLLVNTSRSQLLAPQALEQALRAGRPGQAAVDVFDTEPVVTSSLLELPNLVATPHLGYVEKDSYELYFGDAFSNLLAYINGQSVNNLAG